MAAATQHLDWDEFPDGQTFQTLWKLSTKEQVRRASCLFPWDQFLPVIDWRTDLSFCLGSRWPKHSRAQRNAWENDTELAASAYWGRECHSSRHSRPYQKPMVRPWRDLLTRADSSLSIVNTMQGMVGVTSTGNSTLNSTSIAGKSSMATIKDKR